MESVGSVGQRVLTRLNCNDSAHSRLLANVKADLAEAPELTDVLATSDEDPRKIVRDATVDANARQREWFQKNSGDAPIPSQGYVRAVSKLERDLESPYTDQQVTDRVKVLDRVLCETLARLHGTPEYPRRMWVTGSLVHGGFGANSDADVVVDGPTHQMLLQAVPACLQHDTDVQLATLRDGDVQKTLAFFGPSVPVDPDEALAGKNPLQRIYRESEGYIIAR